MEIPLPRGIDTKDLSSGELRKFLRAVQLSEGKLIGEIKTSNSHKEASGNELNPIEFDGEQTVLNIIEFVEEQTRNQLLDFSREYFLSRLNRNETKTLKWFEHWVNPKAAEKRNHALYGKAAASRLGDIFLSALELAPDISRWNRSGLNPHLQMADSILRNSFLTALATPDLQFFKDVSSVVKKRQLLSRIEPDVSEEEDPLRLPQKVSRKLRPLIFFIRYINSERKLPSKHEVDAYSMKFEYPLDSAQRLRNGYGLIGLPEKSE